MQIFRKAYQEIKMGVDFLNFVPNRFDFPYIVVPFCSQIAIFGAKPDNDEFLMQKSLGMLGANINWKTTGELYCGPTTVFSSSAKYNKMIGIDPIELWISPDTYDCFSHVSENGFVGTGAFYGEIDPIKKVEYNDDFLKSMMINAFDFSEAIANGTKYIKKFGLRQSAFYNVYGIKESKAKYACCLVMVPKKRDQDSVIIKIFEGNDLPEIRRRIGLYIVGINLEKSNYIDFYIADVDLQNSNLDKCQANPNSYTYTNFGFIVLSSHLTQFEYENTALIAGITKHEHEEA
jgi:hypothetical protein